MSNQNEGLILKGNPLMKSLNKSLQIGSLSDLIRTRQDQNCVLLLDCSGSMGEEMLNGKTRSSGLRSTVDQIQSQKQMRMIQFGVGWEPSFVEQIPNPSGGTPLAQAIEFAKSNGVGRAIVISDGAPDDKVRALQAAKDFGGRIDVVFVGDPGEDGEAFLKLLAEAAGGESFTGDLTDPKQLSGQVLGLLGSGEKDDEED